MPAVSSPSLNSAPLIIDPVPLVRTGRNWTTWFGTLVSAAVLGVVVWQLRGMRPAAVLRLVPATPAFWIAFAFYYCASPLSEWIIFRRLWAIPAEGFAALLRKLVSNTLLLGYLGEVYFYAWARRHGRIHAAPFGAIKDVAILSAMTGNVATLAMVAATLPLLRSLPLAIDHRLFLASIGIVLGSSAVTMVLHRRIFTLPRAELWWIAGIHAARIGGSLVLAAMMWHIALPGVAIGWWLLLATLRQLVSRLPLIPNKDVVFIAVAAFVVGRGTPIEALMTMMASLLLLTHLAVGAVLFGGELARGSARG